MSLISKSIMLHGNGSMGYQRGADGKLHRHAMKMGGFSTSWEAPRLQAIDPFEVEMQLRQFRFERACRVKLVIKEYLASLKEREELDAMLPNLLSEMGFTVYSRPGRGTRQYGVDVAAVGTADDGQRKIYLFSVKQG